jgi:hypothetical protein
MNNHALPLRSRPALAAMALAALAGLVLAGCGTASPSSSANKTAGSSTPASKKSSSAGVGNSGGSTSVVSANSVPFPIAVGNTWTYSDTNDAVSGGKTVDKIVAISPVSGGQQVTMAGAITTAGTTSDSTAYFIFHTDGSITYPFSQFNTNNSTTKVTLLSGTIVFPSASALAAGQVSHGQLKIQFMSNGAAQDVTADITIKGGGTQTVTVPAGTYTASVVDMTMSETIQTIALSTEVTTYFANGVGPVKSEVVLDEGGNRIVAAQNVLTSFTKG